MTQCHQPEPVGASGSYAISAKLFVPAGAFAHSSSGETFSPEQPKLLNEFLSGSAPPSLKSVLVSLNGAADALAANAIVARQKAVLFIGDVYQSRRTSAVDRRDSRRTVSS